MAIRVKILLIMGQLVRKRNMIIRMNDVTLYITLLIYSFAKFIKYLINFLRSIFDVVFINREKVIFVNNLLS
jgi:hypothetical protein